MLNGKWNNDEEVKKHVAVAGNTFVKFKIFLLREEVFLNPRILVAKYYVWSILLYEGETWSLKVKSLDSI